MMISDIENNLHFIRQVLDSEVDVSNPHDVQEHLYRLSSIIGLSAEMVATTVRHLRQAQREMQIELYNKGELKSLSPTVIKNLIEGKTAEQEFNMKLADRYNASIVHQIEVFRSNLSYLKSEIENTKHQQH